MKRFGSIERARLLVRSSQELGAPQVGIIRFYENTKTSNRRKSVIRKCGRGKPEKETMERDHETCHIHPSIQKKKAREEKVPVESPDCPILPIPSLLPRQGNPSGLLFTHEGRKTLLSRCPSAVLVVA